MGIRDRLKKARKRISESEGTQRLKGDIAKIKQMAKEHRANQEVKAEAKMVRQKVQTKRLKTETSFIKAQNALAKAKGARSSGGGQRMRGPFDAPGAGGMFGQGSPFGNTARGQDLPGLIGAKSFGTPPGMRREGPRKRRRKKR